MPPYPAMFMATGVVGKIRFATVHAVKNSASARRKTDKRSRLAHARFRISSPSLAARQKSERTFHPKRPRPFARRRLGWPRWRRGGNRFALRPVSRSCLLFRSNWRTLSARRRRVWNWNRSSTFCSLDPVFAAVRGTTKRNETWKKNETRQRTTAADVPLRRPRSTRAY